MRRSQPDGSTFWWRWPRVGAVVVVVATAVLTHRAANTCAEQDRAAFAERQREEREHDRWMADARWRLDHVVRLTETYERWRALVAATMEAQQLKGESTASSAATREACLCCGHWLVIEGSTEEDVRAAARQYGRPVDDLSLEDLGRPELDYVLEAAQQKLISGTGDNVTG